jgi:hypothetical protein
VTVSGNHAVEEFSVKDGVNATLTGLTIANGFATKGGGFAIDGGTVMLAKVAISGNHGLACCGRNAA